MRQNWDETWMSMAEVISKRSTCTNRQVGCMIVDTNNRPISAGYNGPPSGFRPLPVQDTNDCSAYCPRSNSNERGIDYGNCVSVHAEMNALMFADRRDYFSGTIYVTSPCCYDCAKAVSNSGVKRVVVKLGTKDSHADVEKGLAFLKECGVKIEIMKDEEHV